MADLSRFNAQQLATFDREIEEFRFWFNAASQGDRTEFANWLSELVAVADRQPETMQFTLNCRVNNLHTNEDGEIAYDGVVYLTPRAMHAAIVAWLAGEEFLPSHWMETM